LDRVIDDSTTMPAPVEAFHFRLPTKRLKRSGNGETLTVEERI